MLFDIPFVADWNKIGDYRQRQTDRSNTRENSKRVDYDYKVGDKVLIRKDGILRKAESIWKKEPWTITTIHTNGTIRIQCGTKSENSAIKDYLGEKSFKSSPGKSGKYHSQIKAAQQILTRGPTSPEETKKKTVEKKLDNVEKLSFSDKKMAEMEEKITNTVTEKVKDLLTQFFQQQQPKQEINNKEDIENKNDGKDM